MKIVLKRKQKREEDFFMENNMNLVNNNALKFRKKSRGITLIALVITVVVLLILAGVTIATLTGDNRNYNAGNKSQGKDRASSNR